MCVYAYWIYRQDGCIIGGDFYIKAVPFINQVKLQPFPFFIKSGINDNVFVSRFDTSKAKHGGHPGSTICGRVRTSHENGSNIYFILGFNINFGCFQKISYAQYKVYVGTIFMGGSRPHTNGGAE